MAKKAPIDDCKLCLKTAKLQESHIVPKFFLRASGLLGSRFSIHCRTNPAVSEHFKQDGIKEYLLCQSCEQQLQKWESYARHQFYGPSNPFKKVREPGFVWSGLDYSKMKLFTTSILWRMSVSAHNFYGHVQLGDKHEKRIREMLLTSNPREPWRYGVGLSYLNYGTIPFPQVFSQPERYEYLRRTGYRFILAGFAIFADVASHAPVHKDQLAISLQANGNWSIPALQALSIPFIKEEADEIRKVLGTEP